MQHLRIQNKVLELRKLHGWSQGQVSEQIKINRSNLSLLERGKQNPSQEIADSISKLFNLPVNKIFYI